jgi:four helix bundle protein
LTSQIRRAALSISGNIAEGFGRGHKKDKINFYYYSRGSSMEVMNFMIAGKRLNYFTSEELEMVTEKCNQIVFELNKLIKALNYSQPQSKSQP